MNVITVEEFKNKVATDAASLFILDVREDAEVAELPVKNAGNVHHIPMGDVKLQLDKIPQDKIVIVICRSGARSGMVTEHLVEQGYPDVLNLIGGVMAWEQSNS